MNNQNYSNQEETWDITRSYGSSPVQPAYDHTKLLKYAEDPFYGDSRIIGPTLDLTCDFLRQIAEASAQHAVEFDWFDLLNPVGNNLHLAFLVVSQRLKDCQNKFVAMGLDRSAPMRGYRAAEVIVKTEFINNLVDYFKALSLLNGFVNTKAYSDMKPEEKDEFEKTLAFSILLDDHFYDQNVPVKFGPYTDGRFFFRIRDFIYSAFCTWESEDYEYKLVDEYCTRAFTLIRQRFALGQLLGFRKVEDAL